MPTEFLRDVIENMCECEENKILEVKVEDVKPTIDLIPELKNIRVIFD